MSSPQTPLQAVEGIHHKFNYDNIFIRTVIAGVINILNNRLFITYQLSNTETKTTYIPFYYSLTGDERTLQDFYQQWNDCVQPKMVDGNIDSLPRGIIKLSGVSINTASMTNYLVRGDYVKESSDGQLLTHSARLHSIPIRMTFDVELQFDTQEDSWKLWEKILELLWPTIASSVRWNYVRIPFQMGFPADIAIEKLFQWSFGSVNSTNVNTLMKFSIELETYYPVFDKNTEFFKGNRIEEFLSSEAIERDDDGNIIFTRDHVTISVNKSDFNSIDLANRVDLDNISYDSDDES